MLFTACVLPSRYTLTRQSAFASAAINYSAVCLPRVLMVYFNPVRSFVTDLTMWLRSSPFRLFSLLDWGDTVHLVRWATSASDGVCGTVPLVAHWKAQKSVRHWGVCVCVRVWKREQEKWFGPRGDSLYYFKPALARYLLMEQDYNSAVWKSCCPEAQVSLWP